KSAEEKFKEINEAYEVLGNPENRKKYDTLGANWKQGAGFQPPPGWNAGGAGRRSGRAAEPEFEFGGTGFSDFFEQFFGGRGGFGGGFGAGAEEPAQRRGADIEGEIAVTLDEVLHGSVRTITLQSHGSQAGRENLQSFKVRIPHGVQDGQLIRVAGKGGGGHGGGASGDLFLHVRIVAHPDFRVTGADLESELDLAPWEAALGATLPVATLEDSVTIRIPSGSSPGQRLRVRGRGLPRGSSGDRGDLYVKLNVVFPKELSSEERELWGKLAAKSSFNPRAA
ncbi:MAG: J domain-containing protein, partial [Verrucomicrobiae bacterium]|nr:J domain-containing protein [Verrucomicrobiae bacterium]